MASPPPPPPPLDALGGNRMALAQESRAFARGGLWGARGRVSCTIITGFLGAGKTTLLQHVLASKGDLRLSVLVNEWGAHDVDSHLLDATRASAAALGTPIAPGHAAGGCVCCDVSGAFGDALRASVGAGGAEASCDYLIVEASGLADPGPLARAIEALGEGHVAVDRTVSVVDAEALPSVLGDAVALRQLAAADVMLLNKCDLVSLGEVSDVEDLIAEQLAENGCSLTPPPVVRTRFCAVPLDLVLDMPPLAPPPSSLTSATAHHALGFISHEATGPGLAQPRAALGTPPALGVPGAGRDRKGGGARVLQLPASDHGHAPEGVCSAVFLPPRPLSLRRFQEVVRTHLRPCRDLLRAKGFLLFQELRPCRFVFHASGKARCALHCGALWDCPPRSSLVLIARSQRALDALLAALHSAVVPEMAPELGHEVPEELAGSGGSAPDLVSRAPEQAAGGGEGAPDSEAGARGRGEGAADLESGTPEEETPGRRGRRGGAPEVAPGAQLRTGEGAMQARAAAQGLMAALSADDRFKDASECWPLRETPGELAAQCGVASFGLRGMPLRAIQEEALNSSLCRVLCERGQLFPATIGGGTLSPSLFLLLAFGPGSNRVEDIPSDRGSSAGTSGEGGSGGAGGSGGGGHSERGGARGHPAPGPGTRTPVAPGGGPCGTPVAPGGVSCGAPLALGEAVEEVQAAASAALRSALKTSCACRCDVSEHMFPSAQPPKGHQHQADAAKAFLGRHCDVLTPEHISGRQCYSLMP